MRGLILGFDTEADVFEKKPYGAAAMKRALDSLAVIVGHLREYGAPATFFLVGKLVEAAPERIRQVVGDPPFEIASHTYSHSVLMKTIHHLPPRPLPEVERDLRLGIEALRSVFGLKQVAGLCAPGNFYQGLQGRPDLQRLCARLGFKYVCSDGRGPGDTIPSPFTQPYWYIKRKLLEVAHTGWHCNMLNGLMSDNTRWPPLPSTQLPPKKVETVGEQVAVYRREFEYALENNLLYAPTLHPWSLYRFDPAVTAVRMMLKWAGRNGVRVLTYGQVSDIYYRRENKNG